MLSIQEHRDTTFYIARCQSSINNVLESVGSETANLIPILESPEILYIKSSATGDSRGNTGARKILITGARREGDSLVPITEELDMDGTSYVTTAFAYSEIYDVKIREYGSTYANKGNITVSRLGGDYVVLFSLDAASGVKNSSIFVSPTNTKIKQLSVFINSVSDDIDFTSVFYEITVKKIPALPIGRFSSADLNPSSGDNPGIVIGKYICSGGPTVLEMYEGLNASDIVFCTAKNLTSTDTYSVLTEMVIYE